MSSTEYNVNYQLLEQRKPSCILFSVFYVLPMMTMISSLSLYSEYLYLTCCIIHKAEKGELDMYHRSV